MIYFCILFIQIQLFIYLFVITNAIIFPISIKILKKSWLPNMVCFVTDQLLGAFGPKLKEIVITGDKLHTISLDALEGMYFKFIDIYTIRYLNTRNDK